jgi:hypothetical protein
VGFRQADNGFIVEGTLALQVWCHAELVEASLPRNAIQSIDFTSAVEMLRLRSA